MIAAVLSFAMFFGLTALVFLTKIDITYMHGFLSALFWILIFSAIMVFIWPGRSVQIFCCVAVMAVMSVFIIYDTRVIADHEKH